MNCADLMKTQLQWIDGGATVLEAARAMRDHSMGYLLVSNPSPEHPVGVVTDRDLAVRACAEGLDSGTTPVGQVTTLGVLSCLDQDELSVAEELMANAQKSRLVVKDETGRIVGVISLTEILRGDGARRAVRTANAVLAREANSPHAPLESIQLTASTAEDEEAASQRDQAVVLGAHRGSMKEFPS